MQTISIAVLIVALTSMLSAKSEENVYSPEQGVICDKKARFCSDSYGISLGMTKDIK